MVEMDIQYLGDLHCRAVHGPSGETLTTDAPTDNHGRGEYFSPTDLVVTAMGTCILTIMGIYAQQSGIALEGARVRASKIMATTPPRRISRCALAFEMPAGLTAPQRTALERIVECCPVRQSLRSDVEVEVSFRYPD